MEMLAEQISRVEAEELGGQEFQLAVLSALLQVILAILLLIPVLAILYIISNEGALAYKTYEESHPSIHHVPSRTLVAPNKLNRPQKASRLSPMNDKNWYEKKMKD